MFRRASAAAVALGCAIVLMTGCGGSPAPVETTPTFSSEDEAFAAAEATYRAYVDALNQVDLADPATFEGVFALTTGEANANARKSFSQMHADGWTVSGVSTATVVDPVDAEDDVRLAICLDVSEVDVIGPDGVSQVDPNRVDVQSMLVTVSSASDGSDWQIARFEGRDGEPVCESE